MTAVTHESWWRPLTRKRRRRAAAAPLKRPTFSLRRRSLWTSHFRSAQRPERSTVNPRLINNKSITFSGAQWPAITVTDSGSVITQPVASFSDQQIGNTRSLSLPESDHFFSSSFLILEKDAINLMVEKKTVGRYRYFVASFTDPQEPFHQHL